MSSLNIDCNSDLQFVATINESNVVLSNCTVISNCFCSPFQVIPPLHGMESTLSVFECIYTSSRSSTILPLSSPLEADVSSSTLSNSESYSYSRSLLHIPFTITAIGLSLEHTHLLLATGPLFDFGASLNQPHSINSVFTTLQSAVFTNMTSPRRSNQNVRIGSLSSQRFLKSIVRDTSNHLYGTVCADINSGGHIICVNSSFSHCQTFVNPETISEHFTKEDRLDLNQPPRYIILLCTFDQCESLEMGGAIVCRTSVEINVTQCSFKECRSDQDGGAIGIDATQSPFFIFELRQTCFVSCSAKGAGGSIRIGECESHNIVQCIFMKSESERGGGGILLCGWNAFTPTNSISECVFDECRTTSQQPAEGGGAILYLNTLHVTLDGVHFIDCASGLYQGHDIMLCDGASSNNIHGCFSTSENPHVSFTNGDEVENVFHKLEWNSDVTEVTASKMNEGEEVVGARLSTIEHSVLLLLLDNSNLGMPWDSNPLEPRLIAIQIGTEMMPLQTGTTLVPVGEKGLLRSTVTECKVVRAYLPRSACRIEIIDPLPIEPAEIVVLGAEIQVDTSEETGTIALTAWAIQSLTFDAFISGFTSPLQFEFEDALLNQTKSKKVDISFLEGDNTLKLNGNYFIVDVIPDYPFSRPLIYPYPFPIPLPEPILTSVTPSYSPDKKTLTFSFAGKYFREAYTFVFRGNGPIYPSLSVNVNFDQKSSGSTTLTLFHITPTLINVQYNTTYQLSYYTGPNSKFYGEPPSISFTTITAPCRITALTSVAYEGQMNTVLVSISSIGMLTTETYEIILENTLDGTDTPTVEATFTSSTTGSFTSSLYPTRTLSFGATYKIKSVTKKEGDGEEVYWEPDIRMTIDDEPPRIISASGSITGENQATIELAGLELSDGSYKVTLTPPSGPPLTTIDTPSKVGNGPITFEHAVGSSGSGVILLDTSYTVSVSLNAVPVFVNDNVTLKIVAPTGGVETASFVYLNSLKTAGSIRIGGQSLTPHRPYEITLNTTQTFRITFDSATGGDSSAILLGDNGELNFGQEYKIESIISVDLVGEAREIVSLNSQLTFEIDPRSDSATLFIDAASTDSTGICGDRLSPCQTVEAAWGVMERVGFSRPTLAVIDSASHAAPIVVRSGMSTDINRESTGQPSIRIPATASMGEKDGMIVVEGTLEIEHVKIEIANTNQDFVYLFAKSSTVSLSSCRLSGSVQTTNHANTERTTDTTNKQHQNEVEHLCSWSSGVIQLSKSSLTLSNTQIINFEQGALNVDGGDVTIDAGTFRDNSPSLSSFPSYRRNIHCSGDATIEVGSLVGGDGSGDQHVSAWMLVEDECVLKGDDARPKSPLFEPILSNESKSVLNKTEKLFEVEIVGSTMIPCDLSLIVFEMTKSKKEGNHTTIDLTTDSTTFLSDVRITLKLPLSNLTTLDSSLEWQARLSFGDNQTTDTSFVIQKRISERLAESARDNMKWWLPLVLVLSSLFIIIIVVIVILWRRHHKTQRLTKDDEQPKEELEDIKYEEEPQVTVNPVTLGGSSVSVDETKEMEDQVEETVEITGDEALLCEGKFQFTLVDRTQTLYQRLHIENQRVEKRRVGLAVARGLRQVMSHYKATDVLSKLNSHWVMFDRNGRTCLRLSEPAAFQLPSPHPTLLQPTPHPSNSLDDTQQPSTPQNTIPKPPIVDQATLRWNAPEQSKQNGVDGRTIDTRQVAVFRLGLVLYEIETGLVPFGEQDAVNANRALCVGTLPKMDGVGEDMKNLIQDCITVNPEERPDISTVISCLAQIEETKEEGDGMNSEDS
ncbi:hypothetical protein BLNAU_16251 [Blattamonas nauphoetae]|uniref:Protein kinase domain-containing protein n=1 Tax=Blattamonas nauphoetae TaxID=2049346 RepID=A0ABQ9X8F7_9EUKA|nr:hypothetical protein BLNAU_16251 [Blattamonas nauphoetae]